MDLFYLSNNTGREHNRRKNRLRIILTCVSTNKLRTDHRHSSKKPTLDRHSLPKIDQTNPFGLSLGIPGMIDSMLRKAPCRWCGGAILYGIAEVACDLRRCCGTCVHVLFYAIGGASSPRFPGTFWDIAGHACYFTR